MNTGQASPANGGRLTSADRTVEVEVPPGGVGETVRLRYEPAAYGRRGRVKILRSFHLQAEAASDGRRISTFRAPLSVAVSYTSDEVRRAGLNEATLAVYYLNENSATWQRLPSRVDRARRQVVGTVDHFSIFAVGGETFETAGTTGNAFNDDFANLNAWTTVSGSGSVSGNVLRANGNTGMRDLFIVTNSNAYTDLVYEAAVLDEATNPGHLLGLVIRYADSGNFYHVYIANTARVFFDRVQGGTRTTLTSASQAANPDTWYWLKVQASGSTFTVSFANDVAGSPGTYTQKFQVTDSTFASGAVGLLNQNDTNNTKRAQFRSPAINVTLPRDWSGITQQAGHPGLIWDEVTAAHGGARSMRLFSGDATAVGYASQVLNNAVSGGTHYDVSGWIKTDNVSGSGARIILVEQPSGAQTTVGTQTGTQGWTRYSVSLTLRSDTTALEARVLLGGSGSANFDDVTAGDTFSMTISTAAAPFGSLLTPAGTASDQTDVGAGYLDGNNGAYYVKNRNASDHAVTVTVSSGAPWSGSVAASENSGSSGQRISAGSLRWRLNNMSNLAEAQGGIVFSTSADPTVFDAASACASGSTKQAGTCTYNFDYSLRVRWTEAPGTFNSTVTYSASP